MQTFTCGRCGRAWHGLAAAFLLGFGAGGCIAILVLLAIGFLS
jgi:hypothetical protein